jgi:hypothetical protein
LGQCLVEIRKISGAKFGDIEDSKTWTTFLAQAGWTMLSLLLFTIFMANFIYLKMLNPQQMEDFFPTMSEQSGGGCSEPPSQYAPVFDREGVDSWLTWPKLNTYNEWMNTSDEGFGFDQMRLTSLESWYKKTSANSYNMLRKGMVGFLSFGYDTNTSALYNNILFQSILFFVAFFLWGSHFMLFIVWLVNFVLGIKEKWYWGLFPGILFAGGLAWMQSTQFIVTLLFMGLVRDFKNNKGKTIKKIIYCNIPTILFLFGFNIAMNSSVTFGNVTMFGMLLWVIWATYKS